MEADDVIHDDIHALVSKNRSLRAELELAREVARNLIDALACPTGRDVRRAWDEACLHNGRCGFAMMLSAFESYLDDLAGVKR